jgi:DNA mismatch repair protein MutS2
MIPPERKPDSASTQSALRLGSKVIVAGLGMEGVVTSLSVEEAEVQVGRLRMRARLTDLRMPNEEPTPFVEAKPKGKPKTEMTKPAKETSAPIGLEIDLRGERAEDALDRLDRYLADAYTSGLPFVRVIHGKGTGRLRQVIREALRGNTMVDRFDSGMDNEGGEGVTVVHIKTD